MTYSSWASKLPTQRICLHFSPTQSAIPSVLARAQADQARDANDRWFAWSRWRFLRFLDRHINQAIFQELRLRVEVGNQEAGLLVCFGNLRHQLDVERGSEVLDVLL